MQIETAHGEEPSPRGSSLQAQDAALEEVPFPRYQIALVQDESEMLLQPAYDLFALLGDEADQRWDVELYTERTFEALLRTDRQFDCIVIGLNAAWKSKVVRDALSARLPNTGLCVLHQRERGAVPFLVGDVGVDVQQFEQPIDRVVVADKLEAKDEILLNWPATIALQPDSTQGTTTRLADAEAYCGLTRAPTSSWRTVLEVDDGRRRVPVLLRTRTGRDPPVVVCFVLLQPRHQGHVALLGNILMWCVSGRPEALVVGGPDSDAEVRLVHRKLRMQGIKAVATRVDRAADLDFGRWPFRGIADVVLPAGVDPTAAEGWPASDPAHVRAWLRGGGRILRLGPGEQITVTHGESDAHWVTRRWAVWFLSEPAACWHGGTAHGRTYAGSLIGSRAVLRFLAALYDAGTSHRPSQPGSVAVRRAFEKLQTEGSGIDPDRFGLQAPATFLEPVTRLLRQRLPASSAPVQHIDYSVSTTCAALDINALLGAEPLDARTVAALEAWLEQQFEVAGLEERLEIVRCLANEDLLDRTLETLDERLTSTRPLTAGLETKVREALVACDVGPTYIDWPDAASSTVVERGLRMSPLLSANYLVALGDLEAHWWLAGAEHSNGLAKPDPRVVDRAVIGIGRHGTLLPDEGGDGRPPHEMLSTTALALFAYFGRHTVPTHVIRPESQSLPPQLIASVLDESEQLREENAEVLSQARTIERASTLLGAIALLPIAALVAAVWWLTVELSIPLLARLPFLLGTLALATLGARTLLDRARLCPPWLRRLASFVDEGVPGIRRRWRERPHESAAPTDAP